MPTANHCSYYHLGWSLWDPSSSRCCSRPWCRASFQRETSHEKLLEMLHEICHPVQYIVFTSSWSRQWAIRKRGRAEISEGERQDITNRFGVTMENSIYVFGRDVKAMLEMRSQIWELVGTWSQLGPKPWNGPKYVQILLASPKFHPCGKMPSLVQYILDQ